MSVYLNKNLWQQYIKNWHITDCAVRDRNIIYLCLREDIPDEKASLMWDHDISTRLMVLYLDTPDDPYGEQTLNGFNKPRCGVSRKPLSQGLIVARNNDGDVWSMGGGSDGAIEKIAPGQVPMTWRIKCINDYAYSVGDRRKIYKRTDIGRWEQFADLPRGDGNIEDYGFNDMDAFSESDMYAVGGKGDVWHFDGKRWAQQGFPGHAQLATVTCAGDGHVYISGEGGSLWRGKGSSWESVYKGASSILWNDVLWFEGKLWLASDYQFRIWDGQKMISPTYDGRPDGKIVPICGHMDAYDGLLVVAGPEVVMAYQDGQWRTLVAPYSDE